MLKYTNELFDSNGEGVIILDWRYEYWLAYESLNKKFLLCIVKSTNVGQLHG